MSNVSINIKRSLAITFLRVKEDRNEQSYILTYDWINNTNTFVHTEV